MRLGFQKSGEGQLDRDGEVDTVASGADEVLSFLAMLEKNRVFFSLQHAYAYHAFFGISEALDRVGRRLQSGRDAGGRTHISLLPFLLIVQRQAMSAFEALSSCRSYEAWVLIRPALEAALITGKWVDNPENAAIWSNRHTRKTEYIKSFSGKGLVSLSLPNAAALRSVMDSLNDEFVHANEPYYSRHISAAGLPNRDVFLRLEYFDDDADIEAHCVAFLHLLASVVDALDSMLATTLTNTGSHKAILNALEVELDARAARVRDSNAAHDKTLAELGLWPRAAV